MKTKLLFVSLLAIAIAGCYADNGEDLYNCSANPSSVTYSGTIKFILSGNGCFGCHSGTAPSGGYDLTTHAGLKTVVDNGKLWGAVNHLPGFEPMPQGANKISDCDIKRLKAWLDAGAPNN